MQSKIGCYIIAVAVITVWSTTFVSTKILLRSLSPEEIMFYRHVLAYLVLLAAYPLSLAWLDCVPHTFNGLNGQRSASFLH